MHGCTDRRGALALGLATLAPWRAFAQAPAGAALPAELFFSDPRVGEVVLAPSGEAVAMTAVGASGRLQLVVIELATMAPKTVASFPDGDVGWVHWLSDQRLLFGARLQIDGWNNRFYGGLFAVDRDGGRYKVVRPFFRQAGDSMSVDSVNVHPWAQPLTAGAQRDTRLTMIEPDPVPPRGEAVQSWRMSVIDTATLQVSHPEMPRRAAGFLVGVDGEPAAVVMADGAQAVLRVRGAGAAWRDAVRFERFRGSGAVRPLHAAADGTVYVAAPDGRGLQSLFTLDRATGALAARPLLALAGFDAEPEIVARDDRVLGVRVQADAEVTQWWDEGLKAVQSEVDARLPTGVNRITPARRGNSPFVLVENFADQSPSRWYLWHRGERKLTLVGAQRPQLPVARMAQTDFVRFKARDGLEIPAYVTRPPGAGSARLPVVVLIHGGPWVRGGHWGWNADWQFLASRGYLVVAPEFRGSTGFGRRHEEAGFGQWGLAMQDDIADAAAWAVAEAGGDARRVAALGASYGGYAALMALVRHPQQFRCAVSLVGVTDPLLLFDEAWTDIPADVAELGLKTLIGDPVKDAEKLRAASPLHQARRITAPVLLAWGELDRRVASVHAERLERALRDHNREVEVMRFAEEGHGLRKPENRVAFWTRVEAFLKRHLAAG